MRTTGVSRRTFLQRASLLGAAVALGIGGAAGAADAVSAQQPIVAPVRQSAPRPVGDGSPIEILNVSYDPTRELYQDFNAVFATYWQEQTGQSVSIKQSHGDRAPRPNR